MKGWACIARMGGIGDNLVAASILRPLKRLGYMTEVITSEMAQVIFLNNPFLDKLTVKKNGELPSGDDWQKWFINRAKEYDVFVHLSHSMEVRHALFPGATEFWWPQDYRREICRGSYLETVHKIAGLTPPFQFGRLFFTTEEEREMAEQFKQEIGGKFLAWVLAGSRIDKTYPYSPMAISRIIKELDIPVVLFGRGGAQYEDAKAIMEHVGRQNSVRGKLSTLFQSNVGPDGLHMADNLYLALSSDKAEPGGEQDWPIRRSLSYLLAADIVVTPDTGPAWAVAMEPMPKVVMVSHASPENITTHWTNTVTLHANPDRVTCWPCHRLHNSPETCRPARDKGQAAACMADIPVEDILENVERMLHKNNVVRLQAAE